METRVLPSSVDQWIAARTTAPRSVGHHVSTLVIGMLKQVAPKKYSSYGAGTDEGESDRKPIYEMGYLWEDTLGAILTERAMLESGETLLTGQQEICRDGIIGTPDRIVLGVDGSPIIEETKVTWKWYAEDIEDTKYLYWVLQVKTYCAMVGATRARIRALFVNELRRGDFVVPACWELWWTVAELEEWWTSVRWYAESLEA